MKKLIILCFFLTITTCFGQLPSAHAFLKNGPQHILDDNLEHISFALSLRVIQSDYNGPLLRLRRSSDNAEMDFSWGDNDIIDISAINLWRGTSPVYIVTWYDQSGLARNAVQPTQSKQPQFYPVLPLPYIIGNGSSHALDILTSIQELTTNGDNGTVLTVLSTTQKNQSTFGVLVESNRWSVHTNWSNNNLYFDPGFCCNNTRYFYNASGNDTWAQYSFIRSNTSVFIRKNNVQMLSGSYSLNRCTLNNNFGILYANGSNSNYSNNKITELIMYKVDISNTLYTAIENDQLTFWNL